MKWQTVGTWTLGLVWFLLPGILGLGCSSTPDCTQNGDCPKAKVCVSAKCQDPPVLSCKTNDDCSGTTVYCDTTNKRCVACLKDTDCPAGNRCQNRSCEKAFQPQCQSDNDCAGKISKHCSSNGKCEWQCKLNSDCAINQICREHLCEKKPNNNFCVTDADCANNLQKYCSAAGNCEWECKKDTDCSSTQACQDNKCVTKGTSTGCKVDADCKTTEQPKCISSSGTCVQCLVAIDCPTDKPNCVSGTCEAKTTAPKDCSQGCAATEFCFNNQRCLKKPTSCTDGNDCAADEVCLELGTGVNACLPTCDPTQNKSTEDLTNSSCWGNLGWCYGLSDDNPKEGACYPPQLNIRKWKEECGDETKLDSPTYHLCEKGLSCIDDKNSKYCWKPCDPKKNVGGDPAAESKNPDCEGGKGVCWPLEGGSGACEPASGTTTPTVTLPKPGDLVINEVMADPATGTAGDSNQDGTRHSFNDEFVEIVNVSTNSLTLDGVVLSEMKAGSKAIYTFPKGTIVKPKQAVVVFGGGMTADTNINTGKAHSKFGGAVVYTVAQGNASSSSGLLLSNSGKAIQLLATDQKVIDSFTYGSASCPGNKDQSVTKSPDLTGACKLHSEASPTKALFSPGTKSDGTGF